MLAYVKETKPQDVGHLYAQSITIILEIKGNLIEFGNYSTLVDIAHNYLITYF